MWQQALADWPFKLAEALVFGTALFALAIARRQIPRCEELTLVFGRIWRGLAVVALLAAPMAMLHQVRDATRLPWQDAMRMVPEVVRVTHFGRMWAARMPVVALLMLAACARYRRLRTEAQLCAVSALLLLLDSLSGHAIDHGGFAVAAYFLHQAAAGAWLGAIVMIPLAARIRGGDEQCVEQITRMASKVAGWSVAVLVAGGTCAAYYPLGLNLDHLLYSAYGRTLLAKIALFALTVGVGGYNRYRLLPIADSSDVRASIVRNASLECLLLTAVFALAALLANTPPPH